MTVYSLICFCVIRLFAKFGHILNVRLPEFRTLSWEIYFENRVFLTSCSIAILSFCIVRSFVQFDCWFVFELKSRTKYLSQSYVDYPASIDWGRPRVSLRVVVHARFDAQVEPPSWIAPSIKWTMFTPQWDSNPTAVMNMWYEVIDFIHCFIQHMYFTFCCYIYVTFLY